MDEILNISQQPSMSNHADIGASHSLLALKFRVMMESLSARCQLFQRQSARVYYRATSAMVGKPRFAALPFLAISTVLGAAIVVNTMYSPAYVLTVDGQDLGVVRNQQVFPRAKAQVEARISSILGYDYKVDHEVEHHFALTQQTNLTDETAVAAYLFSGIDVVSQNYVMTIDGEVLGATQDRNDLDRMMETIAEPYVNDNTISISFTKDVAITQEYTSAEMIHNIDTMASVLTMNTNGQTTYEVQRGDTFMALALGNNMTMEEMVALNPDIDTDKLYIGQILNVKEEIPYLGVRTVDSIEYIEEIPCEVVEVEDPTMYQGNTKILDEGIPGQAQVTANVNYINGVEQDRIVTSSVTLQNPTEQVIAVGTKERPTWLPTGNYIWPTSGRITSAFGYRSIFGSTSFHSGIDISASYGSPIRAADGGTVSFAGYQGSYGNLVIINHSDGIQTYYAHNSSMNVSVGDKVHQGQTIAGAGATGRATGVHCHFEIRINGTSVNPAYYLS